MSSAVEQWKDQLGALPDDERAELAHFLLVSLEPQDDEVEGLWEAEASKRLTEIRSGTAKGRPVEDVMKELREELS
jgi:putative addiction module component (TIGR02574 family)